MEKLITIREAARSYGLPETMLRRLVKTGDLPHLRSGSRVYLRPEVIERLGLPQEAQHDAAARV